MLVCKLDCFDNAAQGEEMNFLKIAIGLLFPVPCQSSEDLRRFIGQKQVAHVLGPLLKNLQRRPNKDAAAAIKVWSGLLTT